MGPLIGDVLDLGVLGVPRLDLQPVDEPAPQVADHGDVGVRVQVAVAFEALEQHLQALAEIAGTEVGVTGLGDGLLAAAGRPTDNAYRSSLLHSIGIMVCGHGAEPVAPVHRARAGDRGSLRVVTDGSDRCARNDFDAEVELHPEKVGEVTLDHCCTVTGTSPAKFTIVAGTLAAPRSASTCALMSS